MIDEKTAQRWLEELALPTQTQEILRHPRYWNVVFCRQYMDYCEDLRFVDPQASLRGAEVVPELAYRVPSSTAASF